VSRAKDAFDFAVAVVLAVVVFGCAAVVVAVSLALVAATMSAKLCGEAVSGAWRSARRRFA
jgi:hypothetical protein